MIAGTALAIFAVWKLVICPQIVTHKASSGEALSIPLQQVSRIFVEHLDELSEETITTWQEYFTEQNFWTKYNSIISDPIKGQFRSDLFVENPLRFFSLWANLVKRYPLTAIEAFLNNNYGYWFPKADFWIASYGVDSTVRIDGIYTQSLLKFPWGEWLTNMVIGRTFRSVPFGYLLFSRGFCFWIWLFCGMYCLYNNRRKFPLFMVGFLLWASILISPVYAEFRYVYGLFIGLPVIMASTLSARGHRQVIGDAK